jgi:hypothetical protein
MSSISAGLAQISGDTDKAHTEPAKPTQPEKPAEPTQPKTESLKDLIKIEPIEVTPTKKNENTVTLNIKFRYLL